MAKTKISEFSATPGNNTDIDSINIAEGCAPSGINDAIRELMAQLKDFQTGAVGDSFNGPVGTTTAAAGAFTTLSASSTVTLSGGTANGVPYLNGSKVLTSGSALVFDGTNLGIGTSSPGAQLQLNRSGTGDYTTFRLSNSGASGKTYEIGVGGNTAAAGYANNLYFYDSTAGALRMVLDTSGNLGLGVTPSAWGAGYRVIQIGSSGAIWANASGGSQLLLNANSYFDGATYRYTNSSFATDYYQSSGTHVWRTAPSGTAGNAISFTQAMTLDASGNLLVGTPTQPVNNAVGRIAVLQTIADYAAVFRNSNAFPYGPIVQYDTDVNNTGNEFFRASGVGTLRASIRSNGGLANYQANNVNLSDRREKTNFAPAKSYLDVICAIPVQTFNYIDQNMEDDGGLTLGVIAQDVKAVAPELVMESNWGTKDEPKQRLSIYQTDLQYALMKCIQEQQALIATLQADVAALKAAA